MSTKKNKKDALDVEFGISHDKFNEVRKNYCDVIQMMESACKKAEETLKECDMQAVAAESEANASALYAYVMSCDVHPDENVRLALSKMHEESCRKKSAVAVSAHLSALAEIMAELKKMFADDNA